MRLLKFMLIAVCALLSVGVANAAEGEDSCLWRGKYSHKARVCVCSLKYFERGRVFRWKLVGVPLECDNGSWKAIEAPDLAIPNCVDLQFRTPSIAAAALNSAVLASMCGQSSPNIVMQQGQTAVGGDIVTGE